MAENPTTGDLYKAKAILEADVVAAVDAFMADPTTTAFLFGFDSPPQVPQRSAWRVERGGVAVGDAVAPQPRPGMKPARGPPGMRVA